MMKPSLALAIPLMAAYLQLSAQSPATSQPMRFDVASIRPHHATGDDPSDRQMLPGGRFVARATSVRTLIRVAFGIEDNRVTGLPAWASGETFDINATTADHAEVTTPQQFQQLILTLLEDRFEFKFHREQKEAPVYWMALESFGKTGPALKPSAPDSVPNMSSNSNASKATMKATNMSMADIAAALQRQVGRPVEDHTEVKGKFDLEIEWAPADSADSTYPSLFTVLKEQLGLKLQSAKGTTEMLVIDQINHPSAN